MTRVFTLLTPQLFTRDIPVLVPVVLTLLQMLLQKKVAQACEEHFAANKTDCNKFLKAGATALDVKGIPLGEPAEGQSISPGRKNAHVGNCDRAAKRTLDVG